MTRAEMMRAAREVVQVTFSEYLKIRTRDIPTLVFEGKQCPSFYVGKIAAIVGGLEVRQLIARGKRNVLELRDLIRRNVTTVNDLVLFFVDRDFDEHPAPGELEDVYVTRGYSIENELLAWSVLESFVRANFDVADADDERALREIQRDYLAAWDAYCDASRDLHKLVFVCRRGSVRCLPGDELNRFFDIDWTVPLVQARFNSIGELAELLKVDTAARAHVEGEIAGSIDFDQLEPQMRWRGKYHFDLAKGFLARAASARLRGMPPFSRAAGIVVDPGHPSLLGALAAHAAPPECLVGFVKSAELRGAGYNGAATA